VSTSESPSTPTGWKAGAKALAAFQKDHHGVAKGGMVDGGPRKGSKYATLTDILAVCAKGSAQGLSHTGQARLIGETLLVWREVLHHESGESIFTEHPIPVPDKGLPGQRQQDLGGSITYARKYCLQGLYGLFADDGLDPDELSYGDAGTSKAATPAPAPAPAPKPSPAPTPVTVKKPEQRGLTDGEKAQAIEIIQSPEKGAEYKAEFMKKFYPSVFEANGKLTKSMVTTLEHLQFLDALQLSTPF
jgi:hypothetical protein